MITAGTQPPISIDLGKDEPDMTPNREWLFLAGIVEETFLRVRGHEEQMHTVVVSADKHPRVFKSFWFREEILIGLFMFIKMFPVIVRPPIPICPMLHIHFLELRLC